MPPSISPTPQPDAAASLLYFEDFALGATQVFGTHTISADEIIGFASEFDPQPFHIDPQAAEDSLLGGLAASGWHSCALLMRMICDGFLCRTKGLGGPGIEGVPLAPAGPPWRQLERPLHDHGKAHHPLAARCRRLPVLLRTGRSGRQRRHELGLPYFHRLA